MFCGCAVIEFFAPLGADKRLLPDLGYGLLRLIFFSLLIGLGFAAISYLMHYEDESDKAAIVYVLFIPPAAVVGSILGFVVRRFDNAEEKGPNKAPHPTPMSVTDRAAHAPRQP
jgi:hypothetical protein